MNNIFQLFPDLEGDEMLYIQSIIKDLNENQLQQFALVYRSHRKDPMVILLSALVGFVGIAGVHRFIMNDIGMGLVYLFTLGFCFIGTIIDLVNYKKLAFNYNQKQAQQVLMMVKAAG
jgi:TM2 domain-containing membrane protein YozV